MRIKLLRPSVCHLGAFPAGAEVNIPEQLAQQWIKDGVAQSLHPTRAPLEESPPAPPADAGSAEPDGDEQSEPAPAGAEQSEPQRRRRK